MPAPSPFYEVSLPEEGEYEPYGVAYFPEWCPLHLLPDTFTEVVDWRVPKAELREGGYFDYLANDAGVRLLSDPLSRVIESHRTGEDRLQWLPVSVIHGDEARDYRILHFARDLQPLHLEATKWIREGYPRVPVIRKELIGRHRVFGLHTTGHNFIVSEDMQRILRQEFDGCFTFRPLSVA